jgi:metallo-beta-lactamase class B
MDNSKDIFRYPEQYRAVPFRIYGNLFYVGNLDVGAYLIDSGDGLILIDTTYPSTDALFVQSIWEAGFNPSDVVYILHTHGHFDHFGATKLLVSLSGAKTFLGERDARMFRERPELSMLEFNKYSWAELFVPDEEVADGQLIRRGNTVIRAVSTPGHTDGVLSFFFDVRDGDAVYTAGLFGGVGFNTLGIEFVTKYGLIHSRADFLSSLAKVVDEKVDIILGNHARQTNTMEKYKQLMANPDGPNPFIDPGEWKRFVEGLKAKFEKMVKDEESGKEKT